MKTLWEKGYKLEPHIECFITGDDYLWDIKLVKTDCLASIAHAKTLVKAQLLTQKECNMLIKELQKIIQSSNKGTFIIKKEMEDCHSAIEKTLTKKLGSVGKKIHTGRSRNDQVQAALRLYLKESALLIIKKTCVLIKTLLKKANAETHTPMPGRTHLQTAMPSSICLYLASYAEQLLDDISHVKNAIFLIDRSPLGSAAGYGVPIDLDRAYTAKLLGFSSVQNNVIAVQNSRSRLEHALMFGLENIAITLSRFAEDLILFSLPEFSYFSLPQELCSGSSIMPQKKNPDVLELIRSYAAWFIGSSTHLSAITKGLSSGYQRDVQLSKAPVLQGIELIQKIIDSSTIVVSTMKIQRDILKKSFETLKKELYATDYVYDLIKTGMPFRDAYRKIAKNLKKILLLTTLPTLLKKY